MGRVASRHSRLTVGVAAVLLLAAAVLSVRTRTAAADPAVSVRTFAVGGQPDRVVVGAGAVWVGDSGHVFAVDPTTGVVRPVPDVATPIAVDGDSVWTRRTVHPDTLVRVDPATARPTATVALAGTPAAIAAGPDGLWVVDSTGTVTRVDPVTNTVVATIPVGSLGFGIADAGGSVWVSGRSTDDTHASLWRIDPATDTVRATVTTDANCMSLAGQGDSVWASCGTARRIESDGVLSETTVDALAGVAVGPQSVYALAGDGTLARLSPDTGDVLHRQTVPPGSEGVAVGDGAVWVANPALSESPTVNGRGTLTRLSPG